MTMRPRVFGTRPRIARVSTDLPVPEAPTMPTSSPRLSSKLTSLRISLSLSSTARCCTSSSVASLAATSSSFSVNWRTRSARLRGASGFNIEEYRPSSIVDPCEEHREDTVDHDHHEDRFHHRGRGLPAERFGRSLDPHAFHGRDQADHQRHEGRLDHPDQESMKADGVLQAEQEDFGADPTIEESDDAGAEQRR